MPWINPYKLLRYVPLSQGRKLRLRRWLLEREYDQAIAKGRRAGEHGEVDEDLHMEFMFLADDEARYFTRNLLKQAQALQVPVPTIYDVESKIRADEWSRSGDGGSFVLTTSGSMRLRRRIREERKQRAEEWLRWTPLLSALIGVLGGITGLVAVILKLK